MQETLVGDQMVRGISGGEKKRLTAAEVLVGASNIYFLDEISTGLDSATLYTVIKWVSHCVHTLRQTALVSLLQPPPETFQLFDDVIMITEGEGDVAQGAGTWMTVRQKGAGCVAAEATARDAEDAKPLG